VVSIPVTGVRLPTVNTALALQPEATVTVIVVVPAAIAVTTPAADIVATVVVELDHDDAAGLLVRPAVVPEHAESAPLIVGVALTVTVIDLVQPVGTVYTTLVVPPVTPLTIPVAEPTVATAVLLLLHAPPVTVLLNVVVVPGHALAVPVMVDGAALTVTTAVAVLPDTM